MGSLPYIIASLSLISAVFSGYFNVKNRPMARTSLKTLASVLFLATAIFSMFQARKDTTYTVMVLTALTAGMLGDIFLSVDGLVIEKYRNYFKVIGAICFGVGHILFSAIFLSLVDSFEYFLLFIVGAIPVFLFIMSKIAKIDFGKFTTPVYIYSLMLSLMLITGINLYIQNGTVGSLMILIAAILFTISDSCLVLKEFAYNGTHKPLIYIVLITYYVAQNLFALTVMLSA